MQAVVGVTQTHNLCRRRVRSRGQKTQAAMEWTAGSDKALVMSINHLVALEFPSEVTLRQSSALKKLGLGWCLMCSFKNTFGVWFGFLLFLRQSFSGFFRTWDWPELDLQFEGFDVGQLSPWLSILNACPVSMYRYLLPSNVHVMAAKLLKTLLAEPVNWDCSGLFN